MYIKQESDDYLLEAKANFINNQEKTKKQKIEIIFETEIEVDQDYADFMEMSLEEALAYKIDSIKEYGEDRMATVAFSDFKRIKNVE